MPGNMDIYGGMLKVTSGLPVSRVVFMLNSNYPSPLNQYLLDFYANNYNFSSKQWLTKDIYGPL